MTTKLEDVSLVGLKTAGNKFCLTTPSYVRISGCQVQGSIDIRFSGHVVGRGFWERVRTAWLVLTGRVSKICGANVVVSHNFVAPADGSVGIATGGPWNDLEDEPA